MNDTKELKGPGAPYYSGSRPSSPAPKMSGYDRYMAHGPAVPTQEYEMSRMDIDQLPLLTQVSFRMQPQVHWAHDNILSRITPPTTIPL